MAHARSKDPYFTVRTEKNEVGKIFIISLRLIGHAGRKLKNVAGRTVKYGPQN